MVNRLNKIASFSKLAASIQQLTNLGYPKIFAKLFINKFGKNAHIIARWMNDYYSYSRLKTPADWVGNVGMLSGEKMHVLLSMLESADLGEAKYDEWAEENGYSTLDKGGYDWHSGEYYPIDLSEHVKAIEKSVEEQFHKDVFFNRDLIRDIVSGEVTNLNQYKKMNFYDAKEKYMDKKIYSDLEPVMIFDEGFKWLDVGPTCDVVGKDMKNCGSTGVMGLDSDRTMLALVDENNKPHVVVTFHPNENRISGPQGIGSSAPKEKYHSYILELVEHLGAELREKSGSSKSKLLDLKYILRGTDHSIEEVDVGQSSLYDYFRLVINGGVWFTNTHYLISEGDAKKVFNHLRGDEDFINKRLKWMDLDDPKLITFKDLMSNIMAEDMSKRHFYERMLGVKYYNMNLDTLRKDLGFESGDVSGKKVASLVVWLYDKGFEKEASSLLKLSSSDRPKIELSEFEKAQLGSGNDGRKPYISEENWPELRQHLLDKKTRGYGDEEFRLNPDLVAYTPGETVGLLSQPEVIEWHEKMRNYKIPEEYKTIALVPCASTKPWGHGRCNTSEYYKAYNKIRKQVESGELDDSVFFVTVSEPLGVVPEDMWNDFPAYDNPGLFKDDYLRTGMTAKKWKEKYDRSYKLPFGEKSYDSSISTLSAIIDTFVRNNQLEGRRFVSFVDYRPDSSMGRSTHSDMLNRVEEGFEESPFDRRHKSEYARQKMEDKEDRRGLHSYMVESLSNKESSREVRLGQIFKLAVPRDEGPLWEQPNYGAEYDEDFYPDLDSDEIERETEFDNLYHGRNVIWVGDSGKMVKADSHYVYPIQGNIFYDDKISQLADKINSSPEKVILYAPYGEMSKVGLGEVEESIKYQEDYGHAPLTTGDEDLDEYLKDKEEYLNNNAEYDEEYEIVAGSYDELKNELESQLKEAVTVGSGDLGEFIFQIRDGNHRAFAAIAAGEKYIWIMISKNQMQNIEQGDAWVAGYGDVLE